MTPPPLARSIVRAFVVVPVTCRRAPLPIRSEPSPRLLLVAICNVPPSISVPKVYVLLPLSVCVPVPTLTSASCEDAPDSLMTPGNVPEPLFTADGQSADPQQNGTRAGQGINRVEVIVQVPRGIDQYVGGIRQSAIAAESQDSIIDTCVVRDMSAAA